MSEGQSIIYSTIDILNELISLPFEDTTDVLVVLDEIDSGLSVDNINYIMNRIIEISDNRQDIQFIITFNNYAVCEKFHSVKNIITGEDIDMLTYDDFYKFINSMHNTVLNARMKNMFTGEVLQQT